MKLDKKQQIQEEEYQFPYHYIPFNKDGKFSQTIEWTWGYQYLATCDLIADLIEAIKFYSLMDVGCGDGRLLQILAGKFKDKSFTGIDYSERCINIAKGLNTHVNVSYNQANIINSNLSEQFDIITLIEVLEHIHPDNVNKFLKGVHKNLKKSGILIMTVPSKNKTVSEKHYQHFSKGDLKSLLENNRFQVKRIIFLAKQGRIAGRLVNYMIKLWRLFPNTRLSGILYNLYKKNLLIGNENNTGRILIIAQKVQK